MNVVGSNKRFRVALYIRVSTDEQANEGYSIRAQRSILVDYCKSNDYEIVNIYIDDGYSAKNTKRPQLQQLLTDARENKFDAIIVYKLDRFTRSVRDLYELLEELQRSKVDFISRQEKFDTTTAIGRAMIGILGVFAQFERELIAERVRLGMVQKTKEGKKAGGKHPYGYDKKGQPVEEEFEVLQQLRELYMGGLSFQGVAAYFYQNGIDRRGYEWTASTVALTLENPFYAGINRIGSKLPNGKYPQRKRAERVEVLDVPGEHIPIWTMEEFQEQLERMQRRSVGGHGTNMTYWFNSVLRCGRCGAAMYGRLATGRKLKDGSIARTAYYWCSRRKGNKSCDMPMFRQSHVEHLIMEYIKGIRMDQEAVKQDLELNEQQEADRLKEINRLKRDLEKVRARIKKWQYAFAEDIISADDLKTRMDEETMAEAVITQKITSFQGYETQAVINERLFELVELWPKLNDHEKQEAVTTIFNKVTLSSDARNFKGVKNAFFPATVDIDYK